MPSKKRSKPAPKPRTAHILDLPSEGIINICSYLSVHDIVLGIRQTCKCWHRVSLMPDLWKHIKVGPSEYQVIGTKVSENFFLKLLHQKCILSDTDKNNSACISQFRGLAITNADEAGDGPSKHNGNPSKTEQNDAAHHFGNDGDAPDLSEVRCMAASLEETGTIWPSCSITGEMFYPNMRKLALTEKKALPQMGFLTRYGALQSLHIEVEEDGYTKVSLENKHLIAECFDALKNLKNLQTLKFITHCKEQLDDAITKSVTDFFQSGPKLRRIQLDLSVSEDSIRAIVNRCSELRDLRLSNMKLTAAAFARTAQLPNLLLSTLKVRDCPTLDDKCLEAIALAFPRIKKLALTLYEKTSDEGLRLVLAACSDLTDLKLTLEQKLAEDDAHAVRAHHDLDSRDEDSYDYDDNGVDSDEVCGTDDDDDNEDWETDDEDDYEDLETDEEDDCELNNKMLWGESLIELAANQGKLQKLVLDGFRQLPSSTFVRLFQKQPNLRALKLNDSKINNHAIFTLAKHCPLLHTLDLFGCSEVTSTSLSAAIRCLPWLSDLDCDSFGDSLGTFEELASSRKSSKAAKGKDSQPNKDSRLRFLNLSPCNDLDKAGLSALTTAAPNLTLLTIGECCSLNDECVSVILRNCVSLRFLKLESLLSLDTEINLTDTSLHSIQTLGHALETVEVASCCGFTSAAIAKVVVHSAKLFDINLATFVGRRHTIQHLSDIKKGLQLQLSKLKGDRKREITVRADYYDSDRESGEKTLDFQILRPRPHRHAVNQLVWLCEQSPEIL